MRWKIGNIKVFAFLLVTSVMMLYGQSRVEDDSDHLHKELYLITLAELQASLIEAPSLDSLYIDLLSDAKIFADAKEWPDAYSLITTALDLLNADELVVTSRDDQSASNKDYPGYSRNQSIAGDFQFEAGIDYSQQEFETSFLEGDSVFIEQLRSPFAGFLFRHQMNNTATVQHRLRFDEQFFNYSLTGRYDAGTFSKQRNLEIESGFFHSPRNDQQDFLDSRAAMSFSDGHYPGKRWRIDVDSRFKYYPTKDSLRGNILTTGATIGIDIPLTPITSFFVTAWPRFYREFRDSGYRYWEVRGQFGWRQLQLFRMRREISATMVYNEFFSGFSPDGKTNVYVEVLPRISWSWQLASGLGIRTDGSVQRRQYQDSNDITPNFLQHSLGIMPEFYFGDFTTFGLGFVEEGRIHSAQSANEFSAQADYQSLGGVLKADLIRTSGALLSFEYQLTQRKYPNAIVSVFDSFYSDRLIHSISLFGWLPIHKNWRIQLLLNYDNEQDRQFEQNDVRSTLLNAGIIYQY